MATTVEQLVNEALIGMGYPKRIGDINEGSAASTAALEVFGQTRDELLRSQNWEFARRANVALTLLKGPPPPGGYNPGQPWSNTYAAPGFLYSYTYPSDCLELLAITPTPGAMPDLLPRYYTFRIDNDSSYTPPQKVILTNVPGAVAVYRAQVTDPNTWEAGFTAAFIEALERKLTLPLAHSMELEKLKLAETGETVALAVGHRG